MFLAEINFRLRKNQNLKKKLIRNEEKKKKHYSQLIN